VLLLILINVVLIIIYGTVNYLFLSPKIAYVNTGTLLVGFSEASKIEHELKVDNDKWQGQLKLLQDSLQLIMDQMSKEYNNANNARKKDLQDILSARNQQINNFRQANLRNMEKSRQEKMQSVYEKANLYMREYGKKHRYSIILGTVAGGSILYGDDRRFDITEKIIKGLNERYK
jgi:Skp family chaperone for outer membrane proteins